MALNQAPINLRITHVLPDDPLIKIYGISNIDTLTLVERILEGYNERLREGVGMVRSPNDVLIGKVVLVPRFGKYKRAEILGPFEASPRKQVVRFWDIGGQAVYDISEIRTTDVVQHMNFSTISEGPIPHEYVLAGVLKSKQWTPENLETVNGLTSLSEECLRCTLQCVISGLPLINVNYLNGRESASFISFLINQGLASAASIEQMKLIIHTKYPTKLTNDSYQKPPPGFNPFTPQAQAQTPPVPNPTFLYQQAPTVLPSPTPYQAYNSQPNPVVTQYSRFRGPKPVHHQPQQQMPQNYISETIPIGTQREVYVSHIIDGMQNFTVQLKDTVRDILTPLMVAINDVQPEPYTDPLQPGSICLGRYAVDNTLCRAVVSTVLAEGANLYFVDFGNSEIVPFTEIYKMRAEFMMEKMIAVRFTLAGSDAYALQTAEAQNIFSEIATSADNLIMKVVKPEMQLKQCCELFLSIDGKLVDIKSKVQDKMKIMKPVEYDRLPFKKGTQADVVISYVDSLTRFFIQLDLNQVQLDRIMDSIERYCATNNDKEVLYLEDVNENMTVCAQYREDQKWYRALVISEPDVSGNVEILYVDYGNQDILHYSSLRIMTNEMISVGPMQAVECRLDFDGELSVQDDVIKYFAELTEGNEYVMQVINILPAKILLVDLIDKKSKQNVKNILLEHFSPPGKDISPQSDFTSKSRGTPARSSGSSQGNWRDRQNSSCGEGDFSAFKTRIDVRNNNHIIDADETDNMRKGDTWDKIDHYSSHDVGSKKFERNDVDSSDNWSRKPRREDSWSSRDKPRENRWNNKSDNIWSQHDDRHNDDGREDDQSFKPCGGRDGDRDGGRTFNRDNRWEKRDQDSWNSNRDGDKKPFQKREDTWNSDSKGNRNNDWSSKKNDDWSGNNRGDRDSKPNDDSWGENHRNDRDSKPSNDSWGGGRRNNRDSKPNDDSWGGRRRNDRDSKPSNDSWGGGRRNNRDSKPSGDSWGGKNEGRFKEKRDFGNQGGRGNSNDSSPKTPNYEPAYKKGAQFVEPDYQPGQQLEVVVAWFVNATQFYVMPAENEEFRKLMEIFQTDYSRRERVNLSTLSPNDCIVARYKDNVIYRARFLRSRPGGAIVCFVDYGNNASVNKDEAWLISQEHCTIPAQAICCKLYGIVNVDENIPLSQIQGIDKYFEGDKYTLTFVECVDENGSKTWSVTLRNAENQDICDLLVADSLAVRTNVLKSEPLYDISLLQHQVLAVFSGAVVSSKKFFVHIEPEKAQIISNTIADLVEKLPEGLTALPTEQIIEGEFCLACSEDQEYYRALILSIDQTAETAHILFIDYGDESDVAFNTIKKLPEHLRIYDSQIAECCLYKGEDFQNEEEFLETITNTDLMIKIMNIIDNKLHVILYDITGKRLPYPKPVEETLPPICSFPILRENENVIVTHVTKDAVYIQRSDTPYIDDLSNKLTEFYGSQEAEKVTLELDKFYAAKSGEDGMWYRCKPVDSECQEIYYIDYGNTETVEKLIAIKPLNEKFFESPIQCVGVSTSAQFTVDDLKPIIDAVGDIVFEAIFKSIGPSEWYTDLKCEGTTKTFADIVVETGCGVVVESTQPVPSTYFALATWETNEEKDVRLAFVESPNSIYLHSVEDEAKIAALQEDLQLSLMRTLPLLGAYDKLVAARNPLDRKWYRGWALSDDEVFAIDFGFKLKCPPVKKLAKRFKLDTSNYIARCSMNLQPVSGSWTNETIARLTDLVNNRTNVVAKLEFVKHHSKYVDIKVDNAYLSALFVSEGNVTYKSHDVVISHASSLGEFYLQYIEDQEEIDSLVEKMSEAEKWGTAEPKTGQMLAAQFIDEQWYRAIVVKVEEDDTIVKFIDYGNKASCSQFKQLPEELKASPPFAVGCTLHPVPENAKELDELFIEFVDSQDGCFSAYIMNGTEPMMVMLEYNKKSIEEILEQKKSIKEFKLQPAQVEETVVVSHINSPSSFYVQSETAALNKVEAALAQVENSEPLTDFSENDIVAAMYPADPADDGVWYRAKVTEKRDDGVAVLFFDYGNTSFVSEVRSLPDEAKLIPCLSKHCSFPVPTEQEGWPDVASTRFAELICDGNTVFQITIKEEGDPAIVDLQDHGTSVADELATICKADLTVPVRESSKEVIILSHLTSLTTIWIQFQSPQLDEMINEMANVETFDDLESAEVGTLVAAQFEGGWYRASVVGKLETGYEVLFIDYGNSSEVNLVKSLPEDLAKLSPLAKCCRLKNLLVDVKAIPVEVSKKMQEFIDSCATFYLDELNEIDGANIVALSHCEDGRDLSTFILSLYKNESDAVHELLENENKTVEDESLLTSSNHHDNNIDSSDTHEPLENENKTVEDEASVISSIDQTNDIGGDDAEVESEKFSQIVQNESKEEFAQTKDISPTTEVVKNNEDSSYEICTVEAECENVKDTNNEERIEDEFVTPPSKIVDYYATPEAKVCEEPDVQEVSYSESSSIIDLPEYEELFSVADKDVFENKEFQVSHINSLNSFYVQAVADSNRILLIEKLLKALSVDNERLENAQVNVLAAMKFNGAWFRVKIVEISDSNENAVLCIDHGNVNSSKELYVLPEKLQKLPPLAHHCALRLPDQVTKSSECVSQEFQDIVLVKSPTLKIKILEERNETKIVDLVSELGSVTQKLIETCLEPKTITDEKLNEEEKK